MRFRLALVILVSVFGTLFAGGGSEAPEGTGRAVTDDLRSDLPDHRAAAALELARNRETGAAEAIAAALSTEDDPAAEFAMVRALYGLQNPAFLSTLLEHAAYFDSRFRALEPMALSSAARPALLDALRSSNTALRAFSARMLTLHVHAGMVLEDSAVEPALETASRNERTRVSGASARELEAVLGLAGAVGGAHLAGLLVEGLTTDRWPRHRPAASRALVEAVRGDSTDPGLVPPLEPLVAAAEGLDRPGPIYLAVVRLNPTAIGPALLRRLALSEDPWSRVAAAYAALVLGRGRSDDRRILEELPTVADGALFDLAASILVEALGLDATPLFLAALDSRPSYAVGVEGLRLLGPAAAPAVRQARTELGPLGLRAVVDWEREIRLAGLRREASAPGRPSSGAAAGRSGSPQDAPAASRDAGGGR